jgi:uncharacterized membrane protein
MAAIKRHQTLLIITALAALLRFSTITVESLWYDETFTAWLAGLPLANLIDATMGDVHPPTWYIIERFMALLLGRSEFSLRLVSALAGVALVPAVYRLARSFGNNSTYSLQAAALAAVAPFLVHYSQEARAYSLIYLLTTLATIGLMERRWLLFVATAVFALYLHNLAVFYLAALGWLALYRYKFDWRPLLALLACGLFWLPWVVWGLIPQSADVTNGFWVRPPTIGTPVFTLVSLLFSEKSLLLALVTTPLVAVVLAKAILTGRQYGLLALVLIPLALAVIASAVAAPVLVTRVIGSAAVPLCLLLAPSLIPTPRRPKLNWPTVQHYAMPAAFLLILLAHYPALYLTDRIGRYPWYYNLQPVLSRLHPGDGLFHANLATYIILDYYLPRQDQWVWQQANDLSQSLTDRTKWAMQMQQAQFDDVACRHSRWWLAFYENPTTSDRERAEIARLVQQYRGVPAAVILHNDLVNARVYLLDNVCPQGVARQ